MKVQIPLVDLRAQYLSIKGEIDAAVKRVIAESAFVGNSGKSLRRSSFARYDWNASHEGQAQ